MHDSMLYRQRHKVVNMFGKLNEWRRFQTVMTGALTQSYLPYT